MLLRMISMLLKMPIILSTLRVRLLLMRSDSWVENSPSCLCYGWAMYQLPSKLSSPLLTGPLPKWTGGEVTWQAGGSVQVHSQEIPLRISWEFTLLPCMYICFLYFFLFSHPSQFQKGMNTECSNSSSRIHTSLGPQIFGYTPDLFAQASWWLDHCWELVGWVQPPNQDPFYNPFAPILYQDYQGQPDIKALFLNRALFDVSNHFHINILSNTCFFFRYSVSSSMDLSPWSRSGI